MHAGDVIVRSCELLDVQRVLELWEKARAPHATTIDTVDDLARLLERSPSALLVAERDGELVGALVAAWDGWRGNMYRLAVLPSCRRRGIATMLVAEGENRLRAEGARRVTALVANDDVSATALWRAVGYAFDSGLGRFVRSL